MQRWLLRSVYYGALVIAGAAWLVRDEQPFLQAFAIQTVAGFAFSVLILACVWLGFSVGVLVGKLNGVLGAVIGLIVGAAAFFFLGLLSTEVPIIGPAIERVVSLIE
ncbi:MAG: hypothetical protein ABL932_03400 [Terricaulis sp.]